MRIRHGGRLKCLDGPVVIEGLRVVINGKAGKAAALHKISDMVTLSQSEGVNYVQPLALPHLKCFRDYAPDR